MNLKNKWVYGIAVIVAAIASYLAMTFDGDEATKGDLGQTIEQIGHGASVLKNGIPEAAETGAE